MNLKGVLRVDEEGVEEGYRDEQEESDEVHRSRQHPQTLGAVGGRQKSDHTTNDEWEGDRDQITQQMIIQQSSIAKFPIYM